MSTPSDASRFATRSPSTWEDTVRAEIRHTLNRIRYGHNREQEWARLEAKLASLCRIAEHRNPLPATKEEVAA